MAHRHSSSTPHAWTSTETPVRTLRRRINPRTVACPDCPAVVDEDCTTIHPHAARRRMAIRADNNRTDRITTTLRIPTGAQLRKARAATGLTIAQLAEIGGISVDTLRRLERVDGLTPSGDAAALLAIWYHNDAATARPPQPPPPPPVFKVGDRVLFIPAGRTVTTAGSGTVWIVVATDVDDNGSAKLRSTLTRRGRISETTNLRHAP